MWDALTNKINTHHDKWCETSSNYEDLYYKGLIEILINKKEKVKIQLETK